MSSLSVDEAMAAAQRDIAAADVTNGAVVGATVEMIDLGEVRERRVATLLLMSLDSTPDAMRLLWAAAVDDLALTRAAAQ